MFPKKLMHWTDVDEVHDVVSEYISETGVTEPVADVWRGPAIAAEIVKRWNAYEELVAALTETLEPIGAEALSDLRDEDCGLRPDTYNKVCDILAKLK